MLYKFKDQLEDFFVSEVLPFELSGDGDFLYIFFEKEGINTMDTILIWCKKLNIQRFDLGIAGLKDKNGVTQQWLSIGKKTLEKIGGEKVFFDLIEKDVKILEKTWHKDLLKVGMNAGNNFKIKLRARNKINPELKHELKKILSTVKHNGFPNYFGMQRFGKGFRNVKRANKFLYEDKIQNEKHVKFNLQSFSSFHFNEFLAKRIENDTIFLDGCLVMDGNNARSQVGYLVDDDVQLFDYKKCKKEYGEKEIFYPDFLTEKIPYDDKWVPAGLIIGKNMLLSPNQSEAWKFEWEFLKGLKFFENNTFDKFQLYALRRPMLAMPKNMKFEFDDKDNLILEFFLPTGVYATTLLGTVFKGVDRLTCEANGWQIPG